MKKRLVTFTKGVRNLSLFRNYAIL